jgi:hypothetical protein
MITTSNDTESLLASILQRLSYASFIVGVRYGQEPANRCCSGSFLPWQRGVPLLLFAVVLRIDRASCV